MPTNFSQPPIITITVAGAKPDDRPITSHPLVRRRVAPGRVLTWDGLDYQAGAVVALRADLAFPHERSGVLVPIDAGT